MFRYYLISDNRIAAGDDLTTDTLDEAVAYSRKLLVTHPKTTKFSGIEIWHGQTMLYSDACYADGVANTAPVVSPFQTGESTMFSTWRPSFARPLSNPHQCQP